MIMFLVRKIKSDILKAVLSFKDFYFDTRNTQIIIVVMHVLYNHNLGV